MISALRRISHVIDKFNGAIGHIFAWCLTCSIVVSVANALARKFLLWSSNSLLEIQWYLFGATFMLCAAWTLREDKHVRIDIFSSMMSPITRAIVETLGTILIIVPFSGTVFYLSIPYLVDSYRSQEMSNNVGGLIMWPAKALISAGFLCLLLQALSEIIKLTIGDRNYRAGERFSPAPEAKAN